MPQSEILLNGVSLVADLSGVLWWPARRWLVVADLHLEKGSAFARKGQFLPPYDTAMTLERLEAACARLGPARVICLGDSFHDRTAAERVGEAEGRRIAALAAAHDWVWIAGNHDPAPPEGWGGTVLPQMDEGGLLFRHEAVVPLDRPGEVSGHYHPKASVSTRGRRVTARCFVSDGRRLALPAFGSFTGGLNVLDPAIRGLFQPGFQVWMLGQEKLHCLPATRLAAEPPSLDRWDMGRAKRG
ncbi:ligase-associated DNA damage response endonuclease PdeM [Aerophototrophica crusticola]|uniref:Ligase-associated DNA damage response endonuclease PdeM n=1 Tax=Aerophototrophica crusticola TaxID=1709002 RepID=A0A858R8J2_9PROT|nr:ligase-associated DNA damage response endonuclease PdeM [Rhodospirillaceae bacterium B3]